MISQIFVVVYLASAISAQTWAQSTSTYSTSTASSITEQPKQSDACCAITACNYEKIEIVQKLLAMASSLENSIKAPAECQQQQSITTTTTTTTTSSPIAEPTCDREPYCHSQNSQPSDVLDLTKCSIFSHGCMTAMTTNCSCVYSGVPICDMELYCHSPNGPVLDPTKCSAHSPACMSTTPNICSCVDPQAFCNKEAYCHTMNTQPSDVLDTTKCSYGTVGCSSANVNCTCMDLYTSPIPVLTPG